jgi:hypothetical protein
VQSASTQMFHTVNMKFSRKVAPTRILRQRGSSLPLPRAKNPSLYDCIRLDQVLCDSVTLQDTSNQAELEMLVDDSPNRSCVRLLKHIAADCKAWPNVRGQMTTIVFLSRAPNLYVRQKSPLRGFLKFGGQIPQRHHPCNVRG